MPDDRDDQPPAPPASIPTLNLYTLRYRQGHFGVKTAFIQANSLRHAEAVGKAICNEHIGRLYIAVESAVLMPTEPVADPEAPVQLPAPRTPRAKTA